MNIFKKYITFEFNDFIECDEFRTWVRAPSKRRNKFWETFLQAYPDKKEHVKEAKEFLLESRRYFEKNDLSQHDIQIKLGRVLEKGLKRNEVRVKVRTLYIYKRLAMAATIALIAICGWYIFSYNSELSSYSTDYGEWKTVQLPDESMVQLNANSELILSEDWSEGVTRQVWLKGEAFFTVSKKPATQTKFQVITDDLTVEVLGTEFNVQERDGHTSVYLHEGNVKINMGMIVENLIPGDFIEFSADKSEVIQRKRITSGEPTSWKEGVLQLNNTTILVILREIEEIYGVDIKVSNKAMLSERRTIGVPMQNLDIVVPILEKSLQVEIRKVGNKLLVK